MSPQSSPNLTRIFLRDTDTQREESGGGQTETGPGVAGPGATQQQPQGEQGWGQRPRAEREAWESLPWSTALPTPPLWTSGLQDCQRILLCRFNAPSLRRLAPTVLVNQYRQPFQEDSVRRARGSATVTLENCLLFESIM